MKKSILALVLLVSLTLVWPFWSALAYTLPAEISLTAEAVIMENLDTGTVLYQKNVDKTMYPASLQKIMVALLVLEKEQDLDRLITVDGEALAPLSGTGAAVAGLVSGEQISVRDLLYSLLIPSACDAANVLAWEYGGCLSDFVKKMNDRAVQLGMTGTHFTNAHGLHDDQQYTTPRDMLALTHKAMEYPLFMEITSIMGYKIATTNKSQERLLVNTNLLLDKSSSHYYQYASGIKTGYTDRAGRCLISIATKGNDTYLCIVMGCPVRDSRGNMVRYEFSDTKALFNWAFGNMENLQLVDVNMPVAEIKVTLSSKQDYIQLAPAAPFHAIVPKGAASSVILDPHLFSDEVEAPVQKGKIYGYAIVQCAGEKLGEVDLVAMDSLDRNAFLYLGSRIKKVTKSPLFRMGMVVVVVLIALFIIHNIRTNRKRRRMRRVRSYRRM